MDIDPDKLGQMVIHQWVCQTLSMAQGIAHNQYGGIVYPDGYAGCKGTSDILDRMVERLMGNRTTPDVSVSAAMMEEVIRVASEIVTQSRQAWLDRGGAA